MRFSTSNMDIVRSIILKQYKRRFRPKEKKKKNVGAEGGEREVGN